MRIVVHWIPKGQNRSACGRFISPDLYHSEQMDKASCKRCRKSAAYRAAGLKGVKRG